MKKFTKILLILSLFSLNKVNGQDMHFSQFYSSSVYLNSAFAGAGVCSRVSAIYRNQWTGITKGYSSTIVSYDHYIKAYNLGLGMIAGRDVSGTGGLTTTIINPVLAYETRINRKLGLRFGLQPGFGMASINFNDLTFGDQIARGGNVSTIEKTPENSYYFDIGAGVLAYSSKFWAGLSFDHINTPETSFYQNSDNVVPLKYSLHGGHKFLINEDDETKSVSMVFNYRGQQKFDQLDIGGYYTRDMFNIGLWYRGLPGIKSYGNGYSNNESLVIILGIRTDIMSLGYSYDLTISRLNIGKTHGAHEISLSYQFCSLKNQKGRRILVDCPSF